MCLDDKLVSICIRVSGIYSGKNLLVLIANRICLKVGVFWKLVDFLQICYPIACILNKR